MRITRDSILYTNTSEFSDPELETIPKETQKTKRV
jgi:hypothetical protein